MTRTVKDLKEFLEGVPDDAEVHFRPRWQEPFDIVPIQGFATVEQLGTGKITHITLEKESWDD